jgi:hypothetical protein
MSADAVNEITAERRGAPRQRSFLKGRAYFNNRQSSVDCLIRDISPNGLRLEFPESVTIPDVVELYIPTKDQTLRVHVRWRRGKEAGVQPEDAHAGSGAAPAPALDLPQRVQQLEAEVASLRRAVTEIRAQLRRRDD